MKTIAIGLIAAIFGIPAGAVASKDGTVTCSTGYPSTQGDEITIGVIVNEFASSTTATQDFTVCWKIKGTFKGICHSDSSFYDDVMCNSPTGGGQCVFYMGIGGLAPGQTYKIKVYKGNSTDSSDKVNKTKCQPE